MAKKQKTKISPAVYKITGVMILSLVIGVVLCNLFYQFLTRSEYFTVKRIVIEQSLQFIDPNDLSRLKGNNIFAIDLQEVQRKLSYKYPQISQLKIVRRFPDQIALVAKKREPIAQIQIRNTVLTLDEKGVVLSMLKKADKSLPSINGIDVRNEKVSLGLPLNRSEIQTALNIIKEFNRSSALSSYQLKNVEVEHLSRINLSLSNDLNIIVDQDNIQKKIVILGVVLAQGSLNPEEVRYVDLRFKEPIIGKK